MKTEIGYSQENGLLILTIIPENPTEHSVLLAMRELGSQPKLIVRPSTSWSYPEIRMELRVSKSTETA